MLAACNRGRSGAAKVLIDNGADVEAENLVRRGIIIHDGCDFILCDTNPDPSFTEMLMQFSRTSLYLSAMNGHADAVEVLIASGADIEAKANVRHCMLPEDILPSD